MVFSYLQNKDSVKALFGEVAEKVASRPGGYTRILKTGTRLGDNSDMCIIELVDYNENYTKATGTKSKTRRSKRGAGKTEGAEVVEAKDKAAKTEVKEAPKAEKKPKEDKAKDSE